MASPGAKRRAEDRASVEYLVEQYPEWFLEEGWDGEQSEKRRRQPTPDYSKSVWGKMLLDPALDDRSHKYRCHYLQTSLPRSVSSFQICWFRVPYSFVGLAACLGYWGLYWLPAYLARLV